MAPPAYSIPSPPHVLIPGGYPSAAHPPFLYRQIRNPAAMGWLPIPCMPRASPQRRKLICIQDPMTGLDVTEEILSSSGPSNAQRNPAPVLTLPANCRRMTPPPFPMGVVCKMAPQMIFKCFHEHDYFCSDEEDVPFSPPSLPQLLPQKKPKATQSLIRNVSDLSQPLLQPKAERIIRKYSRDYLVSLRLHPLAQKEPRDLKNNHTMKEALAESQDKVKESYRHTEGQWRENASRLVTSTFFRSPKEQDVKSYKSELARNKETKECVKHDRGDCSAENVLE